MIRPLLLTISTLAIGWAAPAAAQSQDAAADPQSFASTVFQLVEHRSRAPDTPAVLPPSGKPSSAASVPTSAHLPGRDAFLAFIRAAEIRHALPEGLLDALVATESAYQPRVISSAGAIGLAQLMPATARALGVLNPFDPRSNVDGGARFLRLMLDRFGSVTLALAAYNAGPGAVARAGGVPSNAETPAYVRKVLALWRASRL